MLLDFCKLREKRFGFASDPDFPCLRQTHRATESARVFDMNVVTRLQDELRRVCDSMLVGVSPVNCSVAGTTFKRTSDSFVSLLEGSSTRIVVAPQVTENLCQARA